MNRGYSLLLNSLIVIAVVAHSRGEETSPVAVKIECPSPQVRSGAEVKLVITVVNTSDRAVSVYRAAGPDGQAEAVNKIVVRDSSGNSVGRIDGQTVSIGGTRHKIPPTWLSRKGVILKPGEQMVDFALLNKLFDMGKPGTYTVTVQNEMRADDPGPEVKFIDTASNTVEITVSN